MTELDGDALREIEYILNSESAEWLELNHPGLAETILIAINQGYTVHQIDVAVKVHTDRPKLAKRIEQAAKYYRSIKKNDDPKDNARV